MSTLTCRIVRPDKLLFEGEVASVVLATQTGELGVLPNHASEICALGDGVMRVTPSPEVGGPVRGIIISGGYAEIADNMVVVLANHARATDDIEPERVKEVRQEAVEARDAIPEGDHRRAYYVNKINWCDLLLKNAEPQSQQ